MANAETPPPARLVRSTRRLEWEDHPDGLAVMRSIIDDDVWRVDLRNGDMSDTLVMGGIRAVKRYAEQHYMPDYAKRLRWIRKDTDQWSMEIGYLAD